MRFFIIALILMVTPAEARPITYPGGWSFMTMNDSDMNALHLFYSPSAEYSLGLNHAYMRDSGTHMDAGQINYLVKRWNKPNGQANLYINGGVGVANKSGEFNPAIYAGMNADWENRRLFTAYENRALWADNADQFVKQKARIGVAPYKGDYGDIHTWLMLQADYDPGKDDSFSLTPLVRVFKGSTLIEAGYNLDGGILFNVMMAF